MPRQPDSLLRHPPGWLLLLGAAIALIGSVKISFHTGQSSKNDRQQAEATGDCIVPAGTADILDNAVPHQHLDAGISGVEHGNRAPWHSQPQDHGPAGVIELQEVRIPRERRIEPPQPAAPPAAKAINSKLQNQHDRRRDPADVQGHFHPATPLLAAPARPA